MRESKLSVPTVTKALENLVQVRIVREATGRQRDRVFVYDRYLAILSRGTEPEIAAVPRARSSKSRQRSNGSH